MFIGKAIAQKDSAVAPLKRILNSKGYILQSPAASWPYAGGFLVSLKNTATFIDLPIDQKPSTQPITADFMAETSTKSFSLSVVLTGMQAIIGGNPGAGLGHTSSLTFAELKAQGDEIEYGQASDLLKNEAIKSVVAQWLNKPKQQVFIIGQILTTSELSATSKSAWNGDLSFNGSPVSKCAQSDPSSKTPTTSNPRSSSSTPPANDEKVLPTTKSKPASDTKSSPSASSGPGGELHLCISNSNTVSMHSDKPLVFAVAAYKVTKGVGGALDLEPVFALPGSKEEDLNTHSTSKPNPAAAIPSTWKRADWPNTR
jgi:hypothetical protein